MMLKTWSEGNETVVQSYFNRLVAQKISQDTVSKVEFSSELVLRNEIKLFFPALTFQFWNWNSAWKRLYNTRSSHLKIQCGSATHKVYLKVFWWGNSNVGWK